MKVFVWHSVSHATDNYHSEGGVVVFAKSEKRARELANSNSGCNISETEKPDAVHGLVGKVKERVFIMQDAGCC